jgi:hypothetical protein
MHPARHIPPSDLRMRDSELFAGLAFLVFAVCMGLLAIGLS